MALTRDTIIPEFRKLGIPIFTAGHKDFELSVATANFLYRYDRPQFVVRPRNGEDVAATVRAANGLRIKITIKNGGHSFAGFSNAQHQGILLDMLDMKAVTINRSGSRRVLTCSAGALWADVYHELVLDSKKYEEIDTESYRWLANGGRCPAVGVAGFILGGGFGPFSRKFGLGADALEEVDFVRVDGEIITVSPRRNPRLFWALQGAGGGMFGIVTRLKIKLDRLGDDKVVAGRLVWNVLPATLPGFQNLMIDFYQARWGNECTIDATWECDLSRSNNDRPFTTRFISYYDGSKESFDNEIDTKLVSSTGAEEPEIYKNVRDQLKRRSIAESSTLFLHETLWSQWAEETRRSRPTDRAYTLYSSWVIKNDNRERLRSMIDTITARIARFREKFTGERGTFGVTCIHIGGKISDVGGDKTAYPWRDGNYSVYILVRWHEKWLYTEMKAFFDQTKEEMNQYAIDGRASYVNFPDRYLVGWAQAYYGRNLPGLRQVYNRWVNNRLHICEDGTRHNPLLFEQSLGRLVQRPRSEGLPSAARARGAPSLPLGQDRGDTDEFKEKKRKEEDDDDEYEYEEAEESEAEEGEETELDQKQRVQDADTVANFYEDLLCKWSHYVPPAKTYEDFAHIESGLPRC